MPTCPTHPGVQLEPKKKGWYCEECEGNVLTYDKFPRDQLEAVPPPPPPRPAEDLLSTLPSLLALPYAEVLGEPNPVVSLWAACDVAEVSLKLCVMAGVAAHAALPEPLARELRDRVELPTLGKWLGMAQAVARYEPPGTPISVQPLVSSLESLLGGRQDTERTGLLALRNRLAHGGPLPRAEAAALHATWTPRVTAWAGQALPPLSAAALVAVDAEGRRVLLRGLEGRDAPTDVPVPSGAPAGSAWWCVGDQALALGPLAAFDVADRALQLYVRRGEVRLQYLRLGESGGLCDSDVDALDAFKRLFLAPAEPAPQAQGRRLVIRGFESEVRRESSRRVGRERELGVLVETARTLGEGLVWISGPAGIGKSNLLAAAMEALLDASPADTLVLPYRFRAGDDRCGRVPFLAFLRERLEGTPWLAPLPEEDAPAATDPVLEVRNLLARLRPGARTLLLLDGMDEVVERDARFVEDVLLRLRGRGVCAVAAGRPERGLPELFARVGAQVPFPEGLPPMGELDVRALLLERTGPVRKRLLARDREAGGNVHNAFVERVTRQSAGLPIYVNYVAGDLNAGKLSPESPEALPASLHAYHDELLRRASVGDLQAVTTPLLVLLALAHEPLGVDEAAALLTRRGVMLAPDAGLVERAVQCVASMVRRAPDPDGDEGYTVFHHSLRTHVLGAQELSVTVAATRVSLAQAAMAPPGDAAEVYLYRCGVRHLLEAGRDADALGLLADFDRTLARFTRLEFTGRAAEEWYADWDRVRARVQPTGETAAWWDFARRTRHHFRRPGWSAPRVLFQAAMDHADDSPVTLGAERFEASGRRRWPYLRWLNRPARWTPSPLVAVLEGHAGPVTGARLLPDGRILSWSADGTLRTWDPETFVPRELFEGHAEMVMGTAPVPGGRVLSWSSDRTLRLWDAATGACVRVFSGHANWVRRATWLGDGRVLSCSWDGTLRVWNGESGEPLAVLSGHRGPVMGYALLDAGALLSWGWDGTLRTWDLDGATPLQVMEGHSRPVLQVELLSGGRALACSSDGTASAWDVVSGELRARLVGHADRVHGARELDGGRVVTWSVDTGLRLWDLESGACLAVMEGNEDVVNGAELLPDGRILSYGWDGSLRLWDGRDGSSLGLVGRHPNWVNGVQTMPGGRVLSWSWDGTVRTWDPDHLRAEGLYEEHADWTEGVLQLPGGRLLSWSADHTLRLWDAHPAPPVEEGHRHVKTVNGVKVLEDGRILSWSWDNTLRLWEGASGAPLGALVGHGDIIRGVHVLPGGALLSWSIDGTLRTWDLGSGAARTVMRGHERPVVGAALLSNGQVLSWSADGTLRAWDAASGVERACLRGHRQVVNGALVLEGGNVLSWSSDGELRRWDVDTGTSLQTWRGHAGPVRAARVLPSGDVESESDDGTVRRWDPSTGTERGPGRPATVPEAAAPVGAAALCLEPALVAEGGCGVVAVVTAKTVRACRAVG